MSVNFSIFQGRLTGEVRFYQPVGIQHERAFFTIAHTEYVASSKDDFKEVVTFIECVCNSFFLSEKARLLRKGDLVTVEGKMKNNNRHDIKANILMLCVEKFGYPEPGRK